jgi:uncharacterized protein involved in outer membrane biogenesis
VCTFILLVAGGSLWLWCDAKGIREWATEKISTGIQRKVTISGPITWKLLPTPTIILKQVSIAEHLDPDSLDLAKVGTLEVSIAVLPLLRRSIVIPSLTISDLEVVLESRADEKITGSQRSAQNPITKPNPVEPPVQILTIHLRHAAVTVKATSSAQAERVTLHEAEFDAVPGQPVRLVASGEYRNVPVMLDATGGTLHDAIGGGAGWWPLALSLQTPETSLKLEGQVGLPFGTPRLDAHLTVAGERLNGLNRLLAVEWPALGPYALSGRVKLADGNVEATEVKAMLGTSDLSGDMSLQFTGRQHLAAHVTSQRINTRDFSPPEEARIDHGAPVEDDMRFIEWLKAWDLELAITSQSVIVGERDVGSLHIQADLLAGLLHISMSAAKVFGMQVNGGGEIDFRPSVPRASVTLTGRGFDPALVVGSWSDKLIGLSDVVVSGEASGTTRQALLNSLAISLRTDRATFLFDDPLSKRPVELRLMEGHALLNPAGGNVLLTGRYGRRLFRLQATTGALSTLSTDRPWPVRVALQSTGATLLVDGTVRSPLDRGSVELTIRGQGKSLDAFASSLPGIGPFRLSGQVTSNGRGSWITKVAWQVGESDGAGECDVVMQDGRLAVTTQLKSRRMRSEDFSKSAADDEQSGSAVPASGRVEMPVVPRHLAAHLTWHIDHFHAGRFSLDKLVLEGSADSGRMEISGSASHKHGNMTTALVLDGTTIIPKLRVQAQSGGFNYGALLRELEATDRVAGTTDLALELSSEGRTLEELLDQVVFQVTARPRTLRIMSRAGDETIPITLSSATISSQLHAPVSLTLQGHVRTSPLSMTVTGVPLKHMLPIPAHLPLTILLRGPDIALEAQGRAGVYATTADFHVHLKGTTLSSLAVLFNKDLPGLASYEFDGNVTVRDQKVSLSALHAKLGKSDVAGRMQIAWNGPRPRLSGSFSSEFIEPKILEQLSPPSETTPETENVPDQTADKPLKEAVAIGEGVVDFVSPIKLPEIGDADSRTRIIPDWVLPVQSFRSIDLDFYWAVKRLSMPPVQMEDVIAVLTLKDGILTAGPLEFGHLGSMTTGKLTVNGTSTVPHAAVEITTTNLDYGGLLKAFKVTNLVEGSTDLILATEGNGRSLRELAGTANGHLDIVAGPARLATRYVELWASNLMTSMLSEAWHREKFAQYHCGAAYIDIQNGEMKTNSLLIEASDHSVVAAGTLNLGTEELDVVVTPRPKDLAFLSLAAPIRMTGPLRAPKISTNAQSIASSKAWQVLDIADPIGLALRVPRVILNDQPDGAGSPALNPCTLALRGGKEALSTHKAVRAGFDWFRDVWRRAGRIFLGQPAVAAGEGS